MQFVTSEFLSADDVPPGTHLHLIVLNYVLPLQTARLWKRGGYRSGDLRVCVWSCGELGVGAWAQQGGALEWLV